MEGQGSRFVGSEKDITFTGKTTKELEDEKKQKKIKNTSNEESEEEND